MSDLNFRIAATLDAGGFDRAATSIRGVGTASGEVTEAMTATAGAVEAVKTAISGFLALEVVQFLRDVVNETINAQQNEQRLKLAVDNTGQSYDRNQVKINNYLEATQSLTGVSKEELVPVLSTLVTKNGDVNKSLQQLNLTVGVSRGMNMDLASAALMVSGVVNGQPRALGLAARAMGLDTQSKKDNALVLAELTKRYGEFSDKQSELARGMEDLTNQWIALKVALGDSVGPALVFIGDLLERIITIAVQGIRGAIDILGGAADGLVEMFVAPFTRISSAANALYQSLHAGHLSLQQGAQDAGQKMYDALTFKGKPTAADLKANLLDPHQAAYLKLNEIEKKALAEGDLASAVSGEKRLQYQLQLLNQESEAQKTALRDQDNYSRLSAQNQAALMESVDQQTYVKRLALLKQYDAARAAEDKNLIDSQIGLTQKGSADWLNLELKALNQDAAARRQQVADTIMTEKQRMQAIQVIDNDTTAKRRDLFQQYYASEIQMADQAAQAIGTSLGASLAGQQDAWKSALTQIIQMIVNYAVKAITANYAVGASTQVAEGGWIGVASGAALMALGAVAVSAISSTNTSPTSSSVPNTAAASASAPATVSPGSSQSMPAQPGITLVVQGDMIPDVNYIDRLAAALSSAVNNRDVRLVATGLNTAAGGAT